MRAVIITAIILAAIVLGTEGIEQVAKYKQKQAEILNKI